MSKNAITRMNDLDSHSLQSIQNRFSECYKTILQMDLPTLSSPEDLCEDFASRLESLSYSDAQIVSYTWLGYSGSFLNEQSLQKLEFKYVESKQQNSGISHLLKKLAQDTPDKWSHSVHTILTPIPKETLIIDVTHTHSYRHVSGIQRVVRNTISSLTKLNLPFVLVELNNQSGTFNLLANDEIQKFLDFHRIDKVTEVSSKTDPFAWNRNRSAAFNVMRMAYRLSLKAINDPYGEKVFARKLIQIFESTKTNFGKLLSKSNLESQSAKSNEGKVTPLLFENKLSLFEVSPEPERIAMYMAISSGFKFRFNMIGYDLLPVLQPEFFYPTGSGLFVNYLRLLRIANSISCISHYTKDCFSSYCRALDHKPNLRIEAHSLATEMEKMRKFKTESTPAVPQILSVSTIEPRKNHLGLLRAAKILWAKGHKFKLVIAGNRVETWLNEIFLQEYYQAKETGLDVTLITGSSEETLMELYQKSSFTVFCSFSEGYGLPIVESLYFGKPCITSNTSSMNEVAGLGGCLTVNPYSILEIAGAIETLLTNREIKQKLESEIAQIKFKSWDQYAEELYRFAMST